MKILIFCPCGKLISVSRGLIGRKKYCSKECMYKYRTRPKGLKYKIHQENPSWFKNGCITWNKGTRGLMPKPWNLGKGNGYINTKGYRIISVDGMEWLEHRYVWTQFYGEIHDGYEIHHINRNKIDNRIENLDIMTKSEHGKEHYEEKKAKFNNSRKS